MDRHYLIQNSINELNPKYMSYFWGAAAPRIKCLTFDDVATRVDQCCQKTKVIGVSIVELAVAIFLHGYCCQTVTPAKIMNFTFFAIRYLFFFVIAEVVAGISVKEFWVQSFELRSDSTVTVAIFLKSVQVIICSPSPIKEGWHFIPLMAWERS